MEKLGELVGEFSGEAIVVGEILADGMMVDVAECVTLGEMLILGIIADVGAIVGVGVIAVVTFGEILD